MYNNPQNGCGCAYRHTMSDDQGLTYSLMNVIDDYLEYGIRVERSVVLYTAFTTTITAERSCMFTD